MNNFFTKQGISILSGTVTEKANLPTPISSYAGEFWFVSEGSGGKWPPLVGTYKYPAAVYSPNEDNTDWVQVPLKVDVAEDTSTILAITDWTDYVNWVKDTTINSVVRYNGLWFFNTTGNITTNPPTVDTINWVQENQVSYIFDYVEGDTYPKYSMVRIGDWTTIANKTTSEYPVPQYSGEEFNVYDGEMETNQVTAKQVIFGSRYIADLSAYIKGYRIFVTAGNSYDIYSVADPLGSKIIKFELDFEATTSGWLDISLAPSLVVAGNSFDFIAVVREPDPTPTTFAGDWNYSKPNNPTVPLSGQITHSVKELNKLLINYIDNIAGDRTVELQALTVGDIIRTDEINWAIQSKLDQGTYIEFDIAPSTQLFVTGVQTFTFETTVTTPITYGEDTDYYLTNPNVQGLFVADDSYNNIVPNDNAYGIDILVQEVVQSEDWTVVASSANLGGGGNKKAVDFLAQVEVTTEGDDEGVIFKNQVSVEGELIAGQDSYPVPIAFHCTIANTTGKVITGAIDITEELQSDLGSTVGLFGGTVTGNYILVGTPVVFEGSKVKYDSLATVEPQNIVAEYYESDAAPWLPVPIMGTDSNPPYKPQAWNIAQSDVEQIFFGFNPLTRDLPDTWETHTFNINGVDYTYKWARIRLTAPITGDPQVQQVKLHTNRIEIENLGQFFYGRARYPIALPFLVVKNDLKDPANEPVDYTPNYHADLIDNELANGAEDGFGIIINRTANLDSSVPVAIGLSFYVKGTATGNIEFQYEVSQVIDGFVYDGNEPFDSYVLNKEILVSQNLVRFSVVLIADISQLDSNSGVVVNVFRDATVGNLNDTVQANIVRTNVNVTAYAWKL